MRKWTDYMIDALFRGVVGLIVFYILKQICLANDFFVFAGINPMSFLLVAILGIPGFLLALTVGRVILAFNG